jgi:hypothetical protein
MDNGFGIKHLKNNIWKAPIQLEKTRESDSVILPIFENKSP